MNLNAGFLVFEIAFPVDVDVELPEQLVELPLLLLDPGSTLVLHLVGGHPDTHLDTELGEPADNVAVRHRGSRTSVVSSVQPDEPPEGEVRPGARGGEGGELVKELVENNNTLKGVHWVNI